MQTRNLTFSALLIAIGTISGHLIYIPVGISKCFPVQHTINVLSAVLLGPWYSLVNAFIISLLRNILGIGTPLAFPGSMIGAFLAGIFFVKYNKIFIAIIGEVIGTGVLGSIVAFPIARYVLCNDVAAFTFVLPFLISTLGGSVIGYVVLKATSFVNVFKNFKIEE